MSQIDLTNADSDCVEAIALTMAYDYFMSASLLKTNPYLRDPKARAAALRISAASSSAIEGIRRPFEQNARTGKIKRTPRKAPRTSRLP